MEAPGLTARVDRAAAIGYSVAAGAYRQGRPSYPQALVEAFAAEAGDGQIVDVGAGTGAMTVLLAARGAAVVAIDPVIQMLGEIEGPIPRVVATAQSLPLPAGCATAVMVANAFHWFASFEALSELRRCLRPGGVLGLAWNERDEREDWVRRHTGIVETHAAGTPRFKTMAWKRVMDAHPHFTETGYLEAPNPTPMRRDQFVARVLSTSFIAALPHDERIAVEGEARELAESLPPAFDYPYLSRLWLYRAR